MTADSTVDVAIVGGFALTVEIEPREGHYFYFYTMFDGIELPARGRDCGGMGQAGPVELADRSKLRSKGRLC
ncbi:MAG: hypothetical protein ABJ246_21845 [Paracoccaceae bacterium]